MLKKYVYLCLIAILLLFNSSIALAQTEIEVTKLETQIMPEYDTADILVVNTIKFSNKSNKNLTGDFKWRVPKGSLKQIVTENTNANNHLQVNIVPNQSYDEMVWKLPNPLKPGEMKDIHLEFYYNNLQGNPDKQFTYDFIPAYPVISAQLLLLQPTKASNLKITPEFGQPMSNQGWTYYLKSFNNIAQDQVTNITVNYTKADPNPSVVPGQQQPGQTQNNQSTTTSNSSNDKVWIFAAAAIAVVIVVAVAYSKVQSSNRIDEDYEDNEEDEELEDDDFDDEDHEVTPSRMSKSQKSKIERIKSQAGQKKKDNSKSRMIETKKKELKRKLQEGLITDIDYFEALEELKDELREL